MTTPDPAAAAWRRFALWNLLGLVAVLNVPSLVWLRESFWQLPQPLSTNAPVLALAFAAAALTARLVGGSLAARTACGAAALAATTALAYALKLLQFEAPYTKPIGAVAVALGLVLVALGEVPTGRARAGAVAALAAAAVFSAGAALVDGAHNATAKATGAPVFLLSAYYPLEITYHDGIVAPADVQVGGGIARAGDRFVGVTGSGAFYLLTWDAATASVESRRIPLPAPHDAAAFSAAMPPSVNRAHFRVMDVAVRRAADRWEVFASHHVWDGGAKLLHMALSKAVLDADLTTVVAGWAPVFETRPAFPPTRDGIFSGDQSGGRLAWLDEGRLLMSTGDHDFNGWNRLPAVSQDDAWDYGKTFAIDVSTGKAGRFTTGHRNPQGIYVDPGHRVWSTEHGPQGGDELNLLVAGGNYGWPLATHGTEYGHLEWPLVLTAPVSGALTPPVFAWVPSIGVSNLIGVEADRFPRWKGNLLVASLRAQTLLRVVMEDGHVAFVEPLPIGRRIRDLVEGPGGDIWMWGDKGELITLVLKPRSRGETVAAGCTSCHSLHVAAGTAPSLEGIVGRSVASRSDYEYSPALKALGGRWTQERLDLYLSNPGAFAPGTLMTLGVSDPEDRAAVIAFLRDQR